MNQAENIMGTIPEGKLLFKLSLPMILSVLVSSLYNLVDSIFVGMLGEKELTAISLGMPASTSMIAVAFGLSIGVNALLSNKLGEKDSVGVSKVAGNGYLLMGAAYLMFLILGLFGVHSYYAVQTSDLEIQNLGSQYTSIVMALSFGLVLQTLVERLLSSTGKTVGSMIVLMTGAIVNLILDPIMIFGLFGFPALGMSGAAIATVIGQCCAAVTGIFLNIKWNKDIRLHLRSFVPDFRIIHRTVGIAIPAMLTFAITSLLTFGINQILISYNAIAPAVYIIYFRVQSFIIMPVWGIRNTIVSLISYNLGANKLDRVKKLMSLSVQTSAIIMLVGALLFEVIPGPLMRLFSATDNMLAIGIPAFRIIGLTLVFSGVTVMRGGIFQAMNSSSKTLIIGIVQASTLLLSAAALSLTGRLTLIWVAFPISEICIFILSSIFYRNIKKRYLQETEVSESIAQPFFRKATVKIEN